MRGIRNEDYSDPEVVGFGFSDNSIRRAFIRKVYAILMVQLATTTAIIAFFIFEPNIRRFVQNYNWLWYIGLGVSLAVMIILACCGEIRRKAPANYFLLGTFTLAEGFMFGVISVRFGRDEVLMAAGITTVISLSLTLFAFQTRWDFTLCGGFLFIGIIILALFGLVALIMASTGHGNRVVNLIFSSLGALLFSLYLIYDTQLIIGGKHQYTTSPEEYIFAALNLYIDIIHIFLYILGIMSFSNN